LFSTKEFIEVSRSYVCIRIETYENKEAEERVRSLLNGRYANTAFCLFDPQGKRRLSRTGRSPSQVMGGWGSDSNDSIIEELEDIASRYRQKGKATDTVLQDFLSFEQALNVASADQRLLVFVNSDKAAARKLSPTLKALFADNEIVGRFHLDFAGDEDSRWRKAIKGAKSKPAINIIRAGKFGLEGTAMSQLPLDSTLEDIKAKLLADNQKFSSTEERKVYASHVMEGKRKGIKYESEIPYGEDRDGDGEIDKRARRGERPGSRMNRDRRRGRGRQ
jgi:hypothetical protein